MTNSRTAATFVLTLAVSIFTSADHGFAADPIVPEDVKGPTTWGGVANVTQLRHLYFSGQPDQAALVAAHEAGVDVVINLRAPSELDWDEGSAVKALGMDYHNVPLTGSTFAPSAIDQIESLVAANAERVVYLHCSSSNRVGGWLAIHLVKHDGQSEAEALAVARRAGINNEAIEERVHGYLQSRPNGPK